MLHPEELNDVLKIIAGISNDRYDEMRKILLFWWENYFNSLKAIVLTTLKVIEDRIFPMKSWSYEKWHGLSEFQRLVDPLISMNKIPKHHGYTIVMLAFDRIEILMKAIKRMNLLPNLRKIFVIWNNVNLPVPEGNQCFLS